MLSISCSFNIVKESQSLQIFFARKSHTIKAQQLSDGSRSSDAVGHKFELGRVIPKAYKMILVNSLPRCSPINGQ